VVILQACPVCDGDGFDACGGNCPHCHGGGRVLADSNETVVTVVHDATSVTQELERLREAVSLLAMRMPTLTVADVRRLAALLDDPS
jgi:hypothetical protein